jgi:adenine specific DNA methylase Mod
LIEPYYKNKSCKLFQCDNIELLKQLPENYIDLIYCDVLYGTGKNFEDYQDLKPIREDIYEHYLPRFIEMKRILKPFGSIYVQLDYKISHWIRIMLDDIFGYKNFINEIIWCYSMAGNAKKYFPRKHDNIFWYGKSDEWCFNVESARVPYAGG